MFRRSLSF